LSSAPKLGREVLTKHDLDLKKALKNLGLLNFDLDIYFSKQIFDQMVCVFHARQNQKQVLVKLL